MMISPEGFYECEIRGKDREGILRVIGRLKREMAKLKRTMEHPEYGTEPIMHPSEATRLWCTRLYLERAREALEETGRPYEPTSAELRVMDFDANIRNISGITLRIGGFFCVNRTYTADLNEEFLDGFARLHVGEWRRYYHPERFGYEVLDGTQWELTIEYANGRKSFTSGGSNAYPYNFRELTELLGIGEEE